MKCRDQDTEDKIQIKRDKTRGRRHIFKKKKRIFNNLREVGVNIASHKKKKDALKRGNQIRRTLGNSNYDRCEHIFNRSLRR